MDSPPMFNSVEDECRYWKERAKLYHKEWTDVKQEYDEYVEQSRQMEAEMDATLDQKQSIIKDLRMKLTYAEKENESLKLKRDSDAIEFANLTKQLENVRNERDSMKEYLRQLEQKNDDLERAHRILNESIVDFERMLDKAYEKNALLEMEVDEKEMLQEKLQRLMDETRDLKQELNVKARYVPNGSANNSIPNGTTATGVGDNIGDNLLNSLQNSMTTATSTTTGSTTSAATNINDFNLHHHHHHQHSLKNPDSLMNGNAMQASSRTTALNIVADMLRKLNLDKALICPDCGKFRCICARPAIELNHCFNANNNVGNLSKSYACTSFSSNDTVNTATTTTTTTTTDDSLGSCSSKNGAIHGSGTNLNFGTNMFKRFAQRMSGNSVDIFASATATPTPPQTPTTTSTKTTQISTSLAKTLKTHP